MHVHLINFLKLNKRVIFSELASLNKSINK
jgi:hypothetical protein